MRKLRTEPPLNEPAVWNQEAEEYVLGTLLMYGDQFIQVNDFLSHEHFHLPAHKQIFKAMEMLFEKHTPIDYVLTGSQAQKEKGNLVTFNYLSHLTDNVTSSVNLIFHARIVKENFLRRKGSALLAKASQNTIDNSFDIFEEIEKVSREITALADIQAEGGLDAGTRADEALKDLRKKMDSSEDVVNWGHESFDAYFGPLEPKLIVIGARPSMGKTALGLWVSDKISEGGFYVPFFSMEMRRKQMSIRELSIRTKIPYSRIAKGKGYISEAEYVRLQTCRDYLSKNNKILVDHTASLDVNAIRSRCYKLKAQYPKMGAIVIDYLQLMNMPPKYNNDGRVNAIGEATRQLKILSSEIDVPVILLSQLNRETERRGKSMKDRRPGMSDLRESGEIEQNADVIIFPMRWEYYEDLPEESDGTPTKGRTEMVVAKNRNGKTGSFWMASDIATNNYYSDIYKPYTSRDEFEGMTPDDAPQTDQPF